MICITAWIKLHIIQNHHRIFFYEYFSVTGDHAYKQSQGLSAEEQMITALPDVRTLMIDPAEDEFMVLACDGIWNFMSSQEVVDFVRPRIQDGQTKLSQICEEVRYFIVCRSDMLVWKTANTI